MDNETTMNLMAVVAERNRRIAELTESLLNAADKIDATESRLAAVEAALVSFAALVDAAALTGVEAGSVWHPVIHDLGKRIRSRLDEIGQRAALGSVVRAAVDAERASERAAIRARVEALPTVPGTIEAVGHREWRPHLIDVDRVDVDDVLAAIGGAS